MTSIDHDKSDLRKSASITRKQAFSALPEAGAALASHIANNASSFGLENSPRTVAVFYPMGSEINTLPLIDMLIAKGHTIGLPVVVNNGEPLIFRAWKTGDKLVDGGFHTQVPEPAATEVIPEILFVPLLAFDKAGYRLGYGGGFYDRTLEKLGQETSPLSIGIAFSAQQVDQVPRNQYDRSLDWIVTEKGPIAITSNQK